MANDISKSTLDDYKMKVFDITVWKSRKLN